MATTKIDSSGVLFPDGTTQASASPGTVVTRIYSSPSPWTKPDDLKAVKVTVLAGGGGGAGARGGASALDGGGGGGGSGGFAWFQAPAIPGPVTVTVGAAGTAGPAPATPGSRSPGGSGGSSSFGALVTATGGGGGTSTFGQSGAFTPTPNGIGFQGLDGGVVGNPAYPPSSSNITFGGNSFQNWGFGASNPNGANAPGSAGTGYGSGGSGASGVNAPSPATGGAGTRGFVIVEEFY